MKFGMANNSSPYRVFEAAEELYPFRAVSLGEGVSLGGDYPIGLTTAEGDTIHAGDDCNVQIFGGSLWQLGDTIQAGAALASDSVGNAIEAVSGKFIFARSLQDGIKDDVVEVLITREGLK